MHANLSDLPEKIGVSASMFHAYRGGKYPISPKAWRKLEAAEQAAGVVRKNDPTDSRGSTKNSEDAESAGNPKQSEKGDGDFFGGGSVREALRPMAESRRWRRS